jgi:hypothetical protein
LVKSKESRQIQVCNSIDDAADGLSFIIQQSRSWERMMVKRQYWRSRDCDDLHRRHGHSDLPTAVAVCAYRSSHTRAVKDIIHFTKSYAMDDVVVKAAWIGNTHDFVSKISKSHETIIHQTNLSGGQKQSRAQSSQNPQF